MSVLEVGSDQVPLIDLLLKVVTYRGFAPLITDWIIDQAIAPYSCAPQQVSEVVQDAIALTQCKTVEEVAALRGYASVEQYFMWIERQIRISKFQEAMWGRSLEHYFLETKEMWDQVVFHLLRIPANDTNQYLALELFSKLEEGSATFETLAHHTQGQEFYTGGVIGPEPIGKFHPKLRGLLLSSPIGRINEPFQLENHLLVVRVDHRIAAQLDEPMRKDLLQEQFNHWLQEQVNLLQPTCKLQNS